eukprot:Nk52_evm14s148 gene=Nk52_evmTU14s148
MTPVEVECRAEGPPHALPTILMDRALWIGMATESMMRACSPKVKRILLVAAGCDYSRFTNLDHIHGPPPLSSPSGADSSAVNNCPDYDEECAANLLQLAETFRGVFDKQGKEIWLLTSKRCMEKLLKLTPIQDEDKENRKEGLPIGGFHACFTCEGARNLLVGRGEKEGGEGAGCAKVHIKPYGAPVDLSNIARHALNRGNCVNNHEENPPSRQRGRKGDPHVGQCEESDQPQLYHCDTAVKTISKQRQLAHRQKGGRALASQGGALSGRDLARLCESSPLYRGTIDGSYKLYMEMVNDIRKVCLMYEVQLRRNVLSCYRAILKPHLPYPGIDDHKMRAKNGATIHRLVGRGHGRDDSYNPYGEGSHENVSELFSFSCNQPKTSLFTGADARCSVTTSVVHRSSEDVLAENLQAEPDVVFDYFDGTGEATAHKCS